MTLSTDDKQTISYGSRLGDALIAEGVISEEQLKRALRIQKYTEQPRQIGQLLIELGFATKQSITEALTRHGVGMRLGDMLLEQGLITSDALEQAIQLQQERKIKLGSALIELGVLTERTLLQNLAHQAGIPYIEPVFTMVDAGVLAGVSPEYMARYSFVPFSKNENGKVTVIVCELHDDQTSAAIGELYKDGFAIALGPSESIRKTIDDYRTFRKRKDTEGGEGNGGGDGGFDGAVGESYYPLGH